MESSEINSQSLPAVRSLRSRFEQLAHISEKEKEKLATVAHRVGISNAVLGHFNHNQNNGSPTNGLGNGGGNSEFCGTPQRVGSPRPRASSNTYANTNLAADIQHLRSSSSSSDLKVPPMSQPQTTSSYKRPPPPPPPRNSKISNQNAVCSATSSPLSSPLLRPVPVPPSASGLGSGMSPKTVFSSLPISVLSSSTNLSTNSPAEGGTEFERLPMSVSSLKSKFDSPLPSRINSPRQSIVTSYPAIQISSNLDPAAPSNLGSSSNSSTTSTSTSPSNKPAIPPRPQKAVDITPTFHTTVLPGTRLVKSPDSTASDSHTSLHSPFSEDEDDADSSSVSSSVPSNPPTLPPRRSLNGQGSTSSLNDSPIRNATTSLTELSISWDNEVTPQQAPITSRQSRIIAPPPRPPPRHTTAALAFITDKSSPSATSSTSSLSLDTKLSVLPPPLPVRRGTVALEMDVPSPASSTGSNSSFFPPPRRTQTHQLVLPSNGPTHDISPPSDRKTFGSSRLPPPPTRTIALGDKLPPPRRPTSPSSDEESVDEEDPRAHSADAMPDSSTSSRRPPVLSFRGDLGYSEPRIHVHPHTGCVVVSGSHVVVGHGHSVKIYNLSVSDTPFFTVHTKDLTGRDAKVSAMEFRPCVDKRDRGYMLWVGTKEGHLMEFDIRSGVLGAFKPLAHPHPISYIFRHGSAMISLDEAGKAHIWQSEEGMDVSLSYTIPRVLRTTEKQDFAKLIDGKLWTAARAEHGFSHGGSGVRNTPIIRVYDLFNPAGAGRSVLPSEHVGAVTSAAVLPSQPHVVYVGHEEGFVSLWRTDTTDGWPVCLEVVRVSNSDVLCLEGVGDRLWAGGRNGMITAYDVSVKPWIVTNCWGAHPGLPVMRLMLNYYGIEMNGKLCVASVGRDECLRLWDGLLRLDWVDKELAKSESSFSEFRELSMLIVSWNCDSARPEALATGDQANSSFLTDALKSVPSPDIIAFGFQEVIDLESRKMTAKNVLLGGKKKAEDAGLSDKVTGAYKRWYEKLVSVVKREMPPDTPYTVVHTESLVGLFSCIFVKNTERVSLSDVAVTTVKRGMGGRYGNKGGIVARFVIGDSSICIINCHLAAGQNAVRRRNADAAGLLEEKSVFTIAEHPLAYVGGGDGSMVLDHEIVFFHGDMNYRIDHRRDAIVAAIRAGDLTTLLPHDQLLREIKFNRGFRLRGFSEGPLSFAPTYKYDPRSNEYDSSEKHRSPAWCDRILWRSRTANHVRQLHYRRYEANVSDHRPISAAFTITVKRLQHEARERAKRLVEAAWVKEEAVLLEAAKEFYAEQLFI